MPLHGRVRSAFARAAGSYDEVSRVYDEIGRRLLTHLDPNCDRAGPRARRGLRDREPGLPCSQRAIAGPGSVAVDCARPMLKVAKTKAPRLFSRQRYIVRAGGTPAAGRRLCANLVHANLLLPWCFTTSNAPLREFDRVLAPGGLLLLSSLGPDTLIENCGGSGRKGEESGRGSPACSTCTISAMRSLPCGPRRCAVMETERLTVQVPRAPNRLIDDLVRSGAWAARSRRPARLWTVPPRASPRLRRRYRRPCAPPRPIDVSGGDRLRPRLGSPLTASRQSFVAGSASRSAGIPLGLAERDPRSEMLSKLTNF